MSRGRNGLLGHPSAVDGHASCVARQHKRLPCRCSCIANTVVELFVADTSQQAATIHLSRKDTTRSKRAIQCRCKCRVANQRRPRRPMTSFLQRALAHRVTSIAWLRRLDICLQASPSPRSSHHPAMRRIRHVNDTLVLPTWIIPRPDRTEQRSTNQVHPERSCARENHLRFCFRHGEVGNIHTRHRGLRLASSPDR
ncbi:hypothetical protein CSPAE12_00172 [Colletotrichum incanum]|nr:hypothetical protein CSPAE12_00172 [Colletotrichum incanum]